MQNYEKLSKILEMKKNCIPTYAINPYTATYSVLKKRVLTVAVPEIWNILEIQKNENLLRSPKFYGENEFPVEMCIS